MNEQLATLHYGILPTANIRPDLPQTENLKDNPIFNFYSIKNDVDFLKDNHMSPKKEEFYLRENVLRFLGEFVGSVPYTKITYINEPTGLDFAGIKVIDSYRKTARLAGVGSREWHEGQGFEKIHDELQQGGPKNILWVSPSKIANYGFAFLFQKDAQNVVYEYILRYPEPLGAVDTSCALISRLTGRIPSQAGANDFLLHPLTQKDAHIDLPTLLKALDINDASIQKSAHFEEETRNKLGPWIDLYIKQIQLLANMPGNDSPDLFEGEIEKLQILFTGIYNMAQTIKEAVDNKQISAEGIYFSGVPLQPTSTLQNNYLYSVAQQQAASRPIFISGGSCPVTRGDRSDSFLSSSQLAASLKLGISPATQIETFYSNSGKKKVNCPSCGNEVIFNPQIVLTEGILRCACGNETNCPEPIVTAAKPA